MRKPISILLTFCLIGISISPLLSVDELYNLTEVYTPKQVEVEESRKICFFPFRNSSEAKGLEYLRTGIPAILVTEIRKIGYIYDENIVFNVIRHQMGNKKDKSKNEKESKTKLIRELEGGGLESIQRRKSEYLQDDLDKLLSGESKELPRKDPRYVPITVQYEREFAEIADSENAIALGSKFNCFYVVTGEFTQTGGDSITTKVELNNLWNGKLRTENHSTSLKRAFQEMYPLAEKLKKSLIVKPLSQISIDSGSEPGALVFIDDYYVGKTPLISHPILDGKHEVFISKNGFQEIKKEIEIGARQNTNFQFALKPLDKTAYISVTSDPSGADVYLGITKIGVTPLNKVKVSAGKNRLRVSKDEYVDHFTGVNLESGKDQKLQVKLRVGDSEIYYKNKDFVFLDYTYKDFSVYTLYSGLLFYAAHAYLQYEANRITDGLRPQITLVNVSTIVALNEANPDLAAGVYFYETYKINEVVARADRNRRWAGDLGLDRQGGKFRGGPMIYGAAFMFFSSFALLWMGLDSETLDIGFDPGFRHVDFGGMSEAKGHIKYNFRF
ncbi:PEGA domain-containing protein [Leptospira sp. GIMC2001]|uniref:PEGA domain-containing protein n=1 Tax=Leptospira sp. GIMC2001 TaxID=1513297 RepID=UPI00234B6AE6|nr:PEGA domain-containing protein [Leptospira sp. GIMC2001]WCL48744.1 PEGA domain-containing protein [Leptospira sp. GIMC2001]